MQPIAYIETDFPQKFGIPRQSGLVSSLEARIVFTEKYANADALRGLEGYSHLWIIWRFDGSDLPSTEREDAPPWRPLVRPPRLGGEEKVGVFASRSPYRPNPIGLSCVELDHIELNGRNEQGKPCGPVIYVRGADLRNGTALYDIKPYVPLSDCKPEATGGFTDTRAWQRLKVDCAPELLAQVPEGKRDALLGVLAEDPRPAHEHIHPIDKEYKLSFAGFEIRFTVDAKNQTLRVSSIF